MASRTSINGLAARIIGGEDAFTNVSCTGSPGTIGFTSVCSNLAQVQFVGKNSTNPEIGTYLNGSANLGGNGGMRSFIINTRLNF